MKHNGRFMLVCAVIAAVVLSGLLATAAPNKKNQKKAVKSAASAQLAVGKKLVAKNCVMCHAIAGKGGQGGPDLTHVGKMRKAAWISAQIRNPKSHKPESPMPGFDAKQINANDLKSVVAYLVSLK